MYSKSGRAEKRAPLEVVVRIASLEHPGLVDSGTTQNTSLFGLRAIVKKQFTPNEPVVVESPPGDLRSRGWVVYCQPVGGGQFAVGLRLLVAQSNWIQKGEKGA